MGINIPVQATYKYYANWANYNLWAYRLNAGCDSVYDIDAGADQPSYFVFEVTGLEGTAPLMLISAMMLCIVCLSCLLCKNYQSAQAMTKGYGKVVMDTDSELGIFHPKTLWVMMRLTRS